MKTNMVLADRTIRMGLGMLLLASPLLELRTYPYNLIGIVLIVTAAVGFCPLYALLSPSKSQGDAGSDKARRLEKSHENVQAHSRAH